MKIANETLSDPYPQCQEGLLCSWTAGKISSFLHCSTWAALSSADLLHIRHWGHFHPILSHPNNQLFQAKVNMS